MDVFAIAGSSYRWLPWVSLDAAFLEPVLVREPGLYRIRRVGSASLDYIGQTGVGIRARVRMLRGIQGELMPFRDPHTAAPALWALLQSGPCEFEASCLPVEGSTAWRKGVEAVAISLYRQEMGRSPTVNFGRMPPGYRMSSGNNARLVSAGKRFRGGATTSPDASHVAGVPPISGLDGDPQGRGWCDHSWGQWTPLSEHRTASGTGLYRIRSRHDNGLVYIGEGRISQRLGAHLGKGGVDPAVASAQQLVFVESVEPEYSCVIGGWEAHQRLELETDLIAAHVLRLGRPPLAQFIG